MLEYTKTGDGTRLSMIVLHDDAQREYAYGPAQGFPDTKVGRFTQALYDEAKKAGWFVISMKNDWKHIFAFESGSEEHGYDPTNWCSLLHGLPDPECCAGARRPLH